MIIIIIIILIIRIIIIIIIIIGRSPRQTERVGRSVEQFDALVSASFKNYLLL